MGIKLRVFLLVSTIALHGCFQQTARSVGSSSSSSSSATAATASTDYCTLFSNNSYDYELCEGCLVSTASTNITTLAACVHANAGYTGGTSCVGLVCGAGQIANFASCACQDATNDDGGVVTPGQDDTSSPTLFPGFSIGNRYCATTNCTKVPVADPATDVAPINTSFAPTNVLQDTGYIRWDLSMDESQYSPYHAWYHELPFLYSSATLAGNFSLSAQLKPNTVVNTTATTVNWLDCPEHFSGYDDGTTHVLTSSSNCINTVLVPVACTLSTSGSNVTATLTNVSMNGSSANFNLTSTVASLTTAGSGLAMGKGLSKADPAEAYTAFPVLTTNPTALFSNIGYYKYTFGPVNVARPTATTTTIASNTVSGQVSLNTNLGYTPISAIDSTAFAPAAIVGDVASRTCTGTTNCVLTSVYRTTGGTVLTQSFGPQYVNHASSVSSLPSGVTAVSTPKIIEDTTQYVTATDNTKAARARVFVRASDGNIYMSRGFRGSWSNWTSLGRPWVADDTSVAVGGSFVNAKPPLKPYTNTFASTLNATYQTPYDGGKNNGISIVGEPMIATMNKSATSPVRGYIAVFARVSQFNSSTGTPGPYHNTVFYTFTATTTTAYASGITLDVDNLSRWSQWMPVVDSTGVPIQIQGNPSVFMSSGSGTDSLYLMATQAVSSNLHPPVAPKYDSAGYDSAVAMSSANWFNYGNEVISAGLSLAAYGGVGTNPGSIANPITWNVNTLDSASGSSFSDLATAEYSYTNAVVVSDWNTTQFSSTATYVKSISSTLFGGVGTGFNFDDLMDGVTEAMSPIRYTLRATSALQFKLLVPGADASWKSGLQLDVSGAVRARVYPSVSYVGAPHAIEISANAVGDPLGKYDCNAEGTDCTADSTSAAPATSARLFIAGRTICFGNDTNTDTSCDGITPTVSYSLTKSLSNNIDAAQISAEDDRFASKYNHSGAYISENQIGTTSAYQSEMQAFYNLSPQLVTSDVIPYASSALATQSNDVPVYLLFRNSAGKIVLGIWNSYYTNMVTMTGTVGPKFFSFSIVGSYTN